MKTKKYIGVALIALSISILTGCSTNGIQPPPSKLDNAIFTITTNTTVVPVTKTINVTNFIPQVVLETNIQNQIVTITNTIPVVVPQYVTVEQTNQSYTYVPKTEITQTASVVGSMTGPWGVVGSMLLAAGLGLWGKIKSNQATTLSSVAGNTAEALAAARAVIAALPNGDSISKQFDTWLSNHQNDVDIAKELAGVVAEYADPTHTNTIAAGIISQITTPLPLPAGTVIAQPSTIKLS